MSASIPGGNGEWANSTALFHSVQEIWMIDGKSKEMHIQLLLPM